MKGAIVDRKLFDLWHACDVRRSGEQWATWCPRRHMACRWLEQLITLASKTVLLMKQTGHGRTHRPRLHTLTVSPAE